MVVCCSGRGGLRRKSSDLQNDGERKGSSNDIMGALKKERNVQTKGGV